MFQSNTVTQSDHVPFFAAGNKSTIVQETAKRKTKGKNRHSFNDWTAKHNLKLISLQDVGVFHRAVVGRFSVSPQWNSAWKNHATHHLIASFPASSFPRSNHQRLTQNFQNACHVRSGKSSRAAPGQGLRLKSTFLASRSPAKTDRSQRDANFRCLEVVKQTKLFGNRWSPQKHIYEPTNCWWCSNHPGQNDRNHPFFCLDLRLFDAKKL